MSLRILFIVFFQSMFLTGGVLADQVGSKVLVLSLKDALQSVDTVNLQVLMANARLQQAIARISQAQSGLLPQIDGVMSTARQSEDLRAEGIQFPGFGPHVGPYNTFDARARVTMALFDPSAFERFQAAKKGANLSQSELQKTREDVMALVASLYLDAERRQQTVWLFKTIVERDQMAYHLSEKNLAQGTGTLLDSNQFKSNLDQTKYLYRQARVQANDAVLDLKAALQVPLNAGLVFLEDKHFLKQIEGQSLANANNEKNADVAMAASQLETGRADKKTAYADFLPRVSGTADYGRSGESPSNGSNTYFVGLQATLPIWDGGLQQAQVKQAEGEIKEAQANLTDAAQEQEVNTAKARAAILEAQYLKEAKFQKCRTAQRALRIALRSEHIGSGTVLGVKEAKADLAVAQDELNEAQATWVMAHIDLLHAQGRLRQLVASIKDFRISGPKEGDGS